MNLNLLKAPTFHRDEHMNGDEQEEKATQGQDLKSGKAKHSKQHCDFLPCHAGFWKMRKAGVEMFSWFAAVVNKLPFVAINPKNGTMDYNALLLAHFLLHTPEKPLRSCLYTGRLHNITKGWTRYCTLGQAIVCLIFKFWYFQSIGKPLVDMLIKSLTIKGQKNESITRPKWRFISVILHREAILLATIIIFNLMLPNASLHFVASKYPPIPTTGHNCAWLAFDMYLSNRLLSVH